MAYKQKNNPFKKITEPTAGGNSNSNDIELAKRLNKLRFDMGHIYPITSEEEVRQERQETFTGRGKAYWEENPNLKEKSIKGSLDRTAQSEKERNELYKLDPSGRGTTQAGDKYTYDKDLQFIKTAREAGGDVFNKVMNMPEKDIVNLERDIVATAQPFRGKNLGKDPVATLTQLKSLNLSKFKPYLEKSGLEISDISKVITSQLNNLPDLNKDGTPDAFEGLKGKVLKGGIDLLISSKLKDLK